MRFLLIIIINILLFFSSYAQKGGVYYPATLEEMFSQMDQALSPEQIKTIKEMSEKRIRGTDALSWELINGYSFDLDSKVIKEFEERGVGGQKRYYLITISYHRYLNGLDPGLEDQYRYYDSLRAERKKECQESQTKERLYGKYIPKDMEDCMIELDRILYKKEKKYILENGTDDLHRTLGMYIRNRWQLWGCSRLEKYFLNLSGESFMHPDSMSGIILDEYEKWLKGDKTAWSEWEIRFRNGE